MFLVGSKSFFLRQQSLGLDSDAFCLPGKCGKNIYIAAA